jgi:hypothetical protein
MKFLLSFIILASSCYILQAQHFIGINVRQPHIIKYTSNITPINTYQYGYYNSLNSSIQWQYTNKKKTAYCIGVGYNEVNNNTSSDFVNGLVTYRVLTKKEQQKIYSIYASIGKQLVSDNTLILLLNLRANTRFINTTRYNIYYEASGNNNSILYYERNYRPNVVTSNSSLAVAPKLLLNVYKQKLFSFIEPEFGYYILLPVNHTHILYRKVINPSQQINRTDVEPTVVHSNTYISNYTSINFGIMYRLGK